MSRKCPVYGITSCGLCLANIRRRSSHKGHMAYRAPGYASKGVRVMPMTRPGPAIPAGLAAVQAAASRFKNDHPTLWGYLAEAEWDDGKARKTSTLTVFIEDGTVKLCLNDRDLGRTAWVTGHSLEDAIDGLELRLCDDSAEWRRSYGGNGRKSK